MMKGSVLLCADLFCGGGGTSTGMIEAFKKAGVEYELIGVNHWDVAIETNKLNHKGTFKRDGVERVSPRKLVPGGRLHFLWASPECTNHSRAKGGRPLDEQSRATAWDVLKWPQELYVDRIYIENVVEFTEWGPLDVEGKKIPAQKGRTFKAFCGVLRSLGYTVDWQVMNAADFGAPTCRRRLIIQAVRGGEKIHWPEPTHARAPGLFGEKPWRTAREVIDWSIPGQSIFTRKKPLAANTLRRIEAGIKKFWGEWAEPFLVVLRGTSGSHLDSSVYRLDHPLPTIMAGGFHAGVVEPMFIPQHSKGTVKPVDNPLSTIAAAGAISVVEPFVSRFNGGENRNSGIDEPLPVVDCSNRYAVVDPFVVQFYSAGEGAHTLAKPLGTVTCKDRFGLVNGRVVEDSAGNRYVLDILFRMLQPHELAAAMGFPKGYRFAGNKSDQVRQIGNAVCPDLSEALISAALAGRKAA